VASKGKLPSDGTAGEKQAQNTQGTKDIGCMTQKTRLDGSNQRGNDSICCHKPNELDILQKREYSDMEERLNKVVGTNRDFPR
jgi:hypothetical protein